MQKIQVQSKINGLRVLKIHTEWYSTLLQGSLERDFIFGLSIEDLTAFQFYENYKTRLFPFMKHNVITEMICFSNRIIYLLYQLPWLFSSDNPGNNEQWRSWKTGKILRTKINGNGLSMPLSLQTSCYYSYCHQEQ